MQALRQLRPANALSGPGPWTPLGDLISCPRCANFKYDTA